MGFFFFLDKNPFVVSLPCLRLHYAIKCCALHAGHQEVTLFKVLQTADLV